MNFIIELDYNFCDKNFVLKILLKNLLKCICFFYIVDFIFFLVVGFGNYFEFNVLCGLFERDVYLVLIFY